MKTDILFICNVLFPVMIEYGEKFEEFNQSSRTGVLVDGRSFKIVIKDEPEWIDRLRGLRLGEYKLMGNATLSPREQGHLQSMMNRG